ncbi:MAG: filamentous hemagglutinin N-terminal domain-containing protein [Spirulina sp. SIO3F2]|nr:filamentous hemagglutinin N-terminal domain-containing protein [Spirulina sp. SIO3F2]
MLKFSSLIASLSVLCCFAPSAFAQSITAAPDGTGTVINQNGTVYDITGGTTAGTNLFHSFQQFSLGTGEIADFLSNPGITNIFGRVVGGDPSIIDGLIRANPNLYLMNPAGIVFGPNASLNVGGDFFATTANRIGFAGNQWLNAFGPMDYSSLLGAPVSFVFTENNGVIINQGNLAVGKNKSLAMLGSGAVTVGSLMADEGVVSVSAVPGSGLVRLAMPGQILGYEFVPQAGQALALHDVGALVSGATSVGLPKELAAGAVLGSGSVAAGVNEMRGMDVTVGDLVAAGGIVVRADGNVVVEGNIDAVGDVRLLGDQDGVDGGSLRVENATIETGGGDFEGVGRGNTVEADGVSIVDSLIDAGDGDFSLTGVGGDSNTTHAHRGVYTRNSTIQADGSISIDGTGGTGRHPTNNTSVPEDGNFGILLRESNVLSNGSGTINISGQSGDNRGVYLFRSHTQTTAGDIYITGNSDRGHAIYCQECNIDASSSPSGFIRIEGHSPHLGYGGPTVNIGGNISSGDSGLIIESFRPVGINSNGSGISIGKGKISSSGNGNISIINHGGSGNLRVRNGEITSQNGDILIENDSVRSQMILSSSFQSIGSGNIQVKSASTISEWTPTQGFEWKTNGGDINIVSLRAVLLGTTSLVSNGGDISIIDYRDSVSRFASMSIGSVDSSSSVTNGGNVYIKHSAIGSNLQLEVNGDLDLSGSLNGGSLIVDSIGGLNILGDINTSGQFNGGDISLLGAGSFSVQNTITTGEQKSGDITISDSSRYSIRNANLGSLDTSGGLNAGNIEIRTRGNVITSSLVANASENAGNISITGGVSHGRRQSSNSIDTTGGIISAAGGINGGDIILNSNGDITTGTVTTFNPGFNGDGGSITIENVKGNIDTTLGDLITASGLGDGGTIELRSQSGLGSEVINGVVISKVVGGHINVADINAQSISNQGGAISLTADQDSIRLVCQSCGVQTLP